MLPLHIVAAFEMDAPVQGEAVQPPETLHAPRLHRAVGSAPPVHPALQVYEAQVPPEGVEEEHPELPALAIDGADAPVHGLGLQEPEVLQAPLRHCWVPLAV